MRRFFFTILSIAALTGTAVAQEPAALAAPPAAASPVPAPPDPVTLRVSRAHLQAIGQGVMKLPYEVAAPILNDLQAQLNEADKAAAEAVKPKSKAAPADGKKVKP